jgi:hypothetical protein
MMQSGTKRIVGLTLCCLVALALAGGGFWMTAEGQGAKKAKPTISAEQAITSIRTAIAAKAGDLRGIEAENEGGKTFCEVEILAQDGNTYEVLVDVATNTVAKVEVDDDDDDDDDDEDDNKKE